jgi:aryl-alcohol dehydrogenase-like predicted oxidoreductase
MEQRSLGSSIRISPLVLGGNVFDWTADEKTSFAILDRYADAGFTAIDTADVYSRWVPGHEGGESERIIGKWLKQHGGRERMVIITKVGSDMGGDRKGLSARYIAQAIDASLRRLQTDYVDVYLSHFPDPSVPYEETLAAFARLVDAGKVREFGASNLNAAQLRESLDAARAKQLPAYAILQPEYNLYDRSSFEGPLRDVTAAAHIAVITYFSLAKGFLTGKYRTSADLGQSPRGAAARAYLNERGSRILAALDDVAGRHRAQPGEIAIAWLIAKPGVTAPIASATTVPQVESLARAASLALSSADIAQLDDASRP